MIPNRDPVFMQTTTELQNLYRIHDWIFRRSFARGFVFCFWAIYMFDYSELEVCRVGVLMFITCLLAATCGSARSGGMGRFSGSHRISGLP